MRLPFAELHAPHNNCRLSGASEPPLERGMVWSIVMLRKGDNTSQPLHFPSYSPNKDNPSERNDSPLTLRSVNKFTNMFSKLFLSLLDALFYSEESSLFLGSSQNLQREAVVTQIGETLIFQIARLQFFECQLYFRRKHRLEFQ